MTNNEIRLRCQHQRERHADIADQHTVEVCLPVVDVMRLLDQIDASEKREGALRQLAARWQGRGGVAMIGRNEAAAQLLAILEQR